MIKTKSFSVQNVGISAFAPVEAASDWLTLEPSQRLRGPRAFLANIATRWRGLNRAGRPGRRLLRNQARFGPWPGRPALADNAARAPLPHQKSDLRAGSLRGFHTSPPSRNAAI